MTRDELIQELSEFNPDDMIVVGVHILDDDGEHIDTTYHLPDLKFWNTKDDKIVVIYPGELVSG